MNIVPQVGTWVWDKSGDLCQVISVGTKRSTGQTMLKVVCLEGQRSIPLDTVVGTAPDISQPLKPGDRALIISTSATGTVAHFDDELGIRLMNIEGLYDPVTGYKVFSQWFDPLTLCCAMQENVA